MNSNLVGVSDLFKGAPRMAGLTSRGFSTLLARRLRTAKTVAGRGPVAVGAVLVQPCLEFGKPGFQVDILRLESCYYLLLICDGLFETVNRCQKFGNIRKCIPI